MAYTDLTATFIYKGLLTYQQMDALGENDAMMIRTDLGGQTITPASAVDGLTIYQVNDKSSLKIVSLATTDAVLEVGAINTSGTPVIISNQGNQTSGALILAEQDHASSNADVVEIDNDGNGKEIKFTHAVTRTLSISGDAFEGVDYAANVDRVIGTDGSLSNVDAGFASQLYSTQVHLPNGVTVTEVQMYYYQKDNTGVISVLLQRCDMQGTAGSDMADCLDENIATAWGTKADSTITNPVIDNTTYSYRLSCLINNNDETDDVKLGGVKILYTITEPLP